MRLGEPSGEALLDKLLPRLDGGDTSRMGLSGLLLMLIRERLKGLRLALLRDDRNGLLLRLLRTTLMGFLLGDLLR